MSAGWDDGFDLLPDTTADEDAVGWGDENDAGDDARLSNDKPPHWQ